MIKKSEIFSFLNIIVGVGIIIAASIGVFYSNGGARFSVVSMYGYRVQMYGDGIYAFNSILTVANRLGADAVGLVVAISFIGLTLLKKMTPMAQIIRASMVIYLAYHSALLVFGITMNSLYFLYVICFAVSLFLAIIYVKELLKNLQIPEALRNKKMKGTGIFLILVGVITALLWGSTIIPVIINNTYGSLLGIQTTEATFGIDLSITCQVFIMCGIWLLKKKEIGYKTAPLLLNIMIGIAILVISQRVFCAKLGIDIPIGALIGFIISFVIMGIISLYLVVKLLKMLHKENYNKVTQDMEVI